MKIIGFVVVACAWAFAFAVGAGGGTLSASVPSAVAIASVSNAAVPASLSPAAAPSAPAVVVAPDDTQIHWQRSLEDALSISAAQKRPLLVAINVDGESGSDRIVTERYRDPRFVQWTRSFVCVVASVSRHNSRDFDERGRRIPCPRLGEVTCGEHVALEPILFDRYLGGERVSPRHAVVQTDGTKSFDVFLLFDMADLDARLAACAKDAPPPSAAPDLPRDARALKTKNKERWGQWLALASARDARGRAAFESVVAGVSDETRTLEALAAVSERGDAGSFGVVRTIVSGPLGTSPRVLERVASLGASLDAGRELVRIARDRWTTCNPFPGSPRLGNDRAWLEWTSRFDARSPGTRAYLLARSAIGADADRRAAALALAPLLSREDVSRVAAAIEAEGGGVQIEDLLILSRDVGAALPRVQVDKPELDSADVLERRLADADTRVSAYPDDVVAQRAFALASSDLARRYAESGGGNPKLLFEDAERWLERVAKQVPTDMAVGFERARTAYYLGKFGEQERISLATFGAWPDRDAIEPNVRARLENERRVDVDAWGDGDARRALTVMHDADRIEALRWVGDAAARLLPERRGQDPAVEAAGYVRGARALAVVATSPYAGEIDWISLASFLSALELERDELAAWQAGVERLPESAALREGLNRSLWLAGRVDLVPVKADWILSQHPDSAACAWYAGYAWLLAAENARREQTYDAAVAAYGTSRARFESYVQLASASTPDADAGSRFYRGMTWLGEGHAHAAAGRRQLAADALVRAIEVGPAVLEGRDGLDRDVPDLVDAILEWRGGRKSPVDPRALADALVRADHGGSRLAILVSDAELREGLRADGRSPRVLADAKGERVRVPDEEGDAYLLTAIDVARLAHRLQDDETTRRNLAQVLCIQGERLLARDESVGAVPFVVEAAQMLGVEPPSAPDDVEALRATATTLRGMLGEARPIFRPGR